jgi:hypothetical protein
MERETGAITWHFTTYEAHSETSGMMHFLALCLCHYSHSILGAIENSLGNI